MPKELTLEQTYDKCVSEGNILLQEHLDLNKIKSMILIAKQDLEGARSLLKINPTSCGPIYKLYYDTLHQLTEAYLLFDKKKSYNHQCLFSYLCVMHPELELDWNFFEKIRTKRNGIHYYGNPITEKDWIEVRLQLDLYIKTLLDSLQDKIDNHK